MRQAIFYEFHDGDSSIEPIMHQTSTNQVTILPVEDQAMIPLMAAQFSDAGIDLIELCGGVSLAIRARVKEVTSKRTRIASVTFGIESIVKAAEFNHAFVAGKPPAEACIIRMPGADPATDQYVRTSGPQNTAFVMSDDSAAANVAHTLVEQGVGLIELYGSFPDKIAAEIIEIIAGRAAVGISGFGCDIV